MQPFPKAFLDSFMSVACSLFCCWCAHWHMTPKDFIWTLRAAIHIFWLMRYARWRLYSSPKDILKPATIVYILAMSRLRNWLFLVLNWRNLSIEQTLSTCQLRQMFSFFYSARSLIKQWNQNFWDLVVGTLVQALSFPSSSKHQYTTANKI